MTMPATPPTPPPTPPAAAPAAPAAPAPRLDTAARAAALRERLEAEPETAEGAAEGTEGAPPPADASSNAGAPEAPGTAPAADDPAAKAKADRLARIAQVRADERAREEERIKQRQSKDLSAETEKLRARVAELEPLNAVFASEDSLLAEAERRGMSAEKLVQWMRAKLTDPAAVASRQAKSEVDKIREELAAERKAREDLERRLVEQQTQTRAQYEAQQRAQTFIAQASEGAATHPLTAAFAKRHGPEGLIAYANRFVAPLLPEAYTLEQLHDYVEQLLEETQVVGGASPAPVPANGASHPPKKNGAAEPATALGNGDASERTTVTEEIPLSRLSREERIRRAREKAERE